MASVTKAVVVHLQDGPFLVLPGDEVPAGVSVSAPGVLVGEVSLQRPRGNASRAAWAAYAESLGVATDGLSRNEIKGAVDGLRERG